MKVESIRQTFPSLARRAAGFWAAWWLVMGGGLSGWAAVESGGREGDFLAWGAGARAMALGRAYVALATDATAAYWNPGGLAFAERSEVSALHAGLWEATTYDFLGVVIPTPTFGTFGAFGSILATGGLEGRDAENNPLESFGVSKAGAGLGYGLDLRPDLGLGITCKWIGRWMDRDASGFLTADIGLRYTLGPWGALGVVVQHVAAMAYGDTADRLVPVVRTGVLLTPWPAWGQCVADVEWTPGSSVIRWSVGVETPSFGPLTARLGIQTWELAGGVGFAWEDLNVDYSGALHQDLGLSHRVSMGTKWGESRTAIRIHQAREAFAGALEAYGQIERTESRSPERVRAMETARAALERVLQYDKANQAAERLLQRLTTMDANTQMLR